MLLTSITPATAYAPLRHPAFRMLWIANLASNTGLWIQNTGAGWLMTSLAPSPVMVSLVQAAAMLPVFLFTLQALGFLALLWALGAWRRPMPPRSHLPPERLPSAVRAGLRFAIAVPAMRAAILRACAFFLFASAVWALLPLVVRERLELGPAAFGLMLGVAGCGAVAAGVVLP